MRAGDRRAGAAGRARAISTTYQRVVTALRAGQGYYPALHDALLAGGYGTLSPLNWRTPLFLSFLALFPTLESAQVLLGLVDGGRVARRDCLRLSAKRRRPAVWAAAIVLAAEPGVDHRLSGRAQLRVVCTGTLILISASGLWTWLRWAGFAVALLALFVRELAVIYAVVCLATGAARAAMGRGWRVAGRARRLCRIYYLWHWSQPSALIGPADHAAASDWLQFGGLVFVLAHGGVQRCAAGRCRYWVDGAHLPLACSASLASRTNRARRATVRALPCCCSLRLRQARQRILGRALRAADGAGLPVGVPAPRDCRAALGARRSRLRLRRSS